MHELVHEDVGFLSSSCCELSDAIKDYSKYDPKKCHDYAATLFNATAMVNSYIRFYEEILNGKKINFSLPKRMASGEPKFLLWE